MQAGCDFFHAVFKISFYNAFTIHTSQKDKIDKIETTQEKVCAYIYSMHVCI